jgi:tRNA/tmRNA/rRNA uracil-C5-methylase (TrmA/RlmC/RlmD family)
VADVAGADVAGADVAEAEHLELEVGAPVHGGSCLARHEGQVVFVRHALPGERVLAVVTERRGGYLRADAVEVLRAVAGRVPAPCPHAGPGRCGGCDWQHATVEEQRRLKAEVVVEQFRRLAGLDVTALLGAVEALPGGALGWRTRINYATSAEGGFGLHRFRDAGVEPIERCLLGVPGVDRPPVVSPTPDLLGVEVIRGDDGAHTVLARRAGPGRQARGRRPPDLVSVLDGPGDIVRELAGRRFRHAAGSFWQVHPHAAAAFGAELLRQLALRPGEQVLELYCGAGALTALLADAVGPTGTALGIESDRQAAADAIANLADVPAARVHRGRVDVATLAELDAYPDVVVLDPPRAGAGHEVMRALVALRPRVIGYVACDPATLARDVATAVADGWELGALRAIDAFPMTHHVECIATLHEAGTTPVSPALP